MNFNIFNSIILAGVIQGIIFGFVVLFSKKHKHKSVYFLTAFIVIYSLSNLQFYLNDIGLISYDQLFRYFYIPWGNSIPVLLFFYVNFHLYASYKISKKQYLLFLPFVISFILSVIYKFAKALKLENNWVNELMYYLEGSDELLTGIFHVIIFSVILNKLYKYSKGTSIKLPKDVKLSVKWLKVTFVIYMFLVLLYLTFIGLYMLYPGEISFYPIWIAIACIIYWFGHMGIYKYGIVEERMNIRKKRKLVAPTKRESKTKHIIIERLKGFLDTEKRFLDASLTLEKTAEALELSQGHLSKIINTELGMSFKDYINALRVEEAKSYLIDNDFSKYTLVAIGLEAGFNSKSAFNSSFKKITGETPSQFKQRHIN